MTKCIKKHAVLISQNVKSDFIGFDIAASYFTQEGILYAGDVSTGVILKSLDHGNNWEKIYQYENGSGPVRCLFVNSQGILFTSRDRSGEMLRSCDQGKTFKQCLTLSNPKASTVWRVAENDKGWLYAAEYSNLSWYDSCAYIYRSKDNGETWQTIYDNPVHARHFHFVAVDPYTNHLYAAYGDGKKRSGLLKSTDDGETWICIGNNKMNSDIDWQFTSIAFTPDYRFFGEDEPGQSDIIRTYDDVHFEKVFIPQGNEKYNFWAWGRTDSKGNILFGSWTQHQSVNAEKGNGVIYITRDKGRTWIKIVDFGELRDHSGTHFASNVTENDWIFCNASNSIQGFKIQVQQNVNHSDMARLIR